MSDGFYDAIQQPNAELVTSPIASHMVGRASFRAGQVRRELLVVDELTEVLSGHESKETE